MRELKVIDTLCSILKYAFYSEDKKPFYDIQKITQ